MAPLLFSEMLVDHVFPLFRLQVLSVACGAAHTIAVCKEGVCSEFSLFRCYFGVFKEDFCVMESHFGSCTQCVLWWMQLNEFANLKFFRLSLLMYSSCAPYVKFFLSVPCPILHLFRFIHGASTILARYSVPVIFEISSFCM